MEEERSELEEEREEAREEREEVREEREEREEAREEETLAGVRKIGQMVETSVQRYTIVLPTATILAWTWKNRAEPAAQKQDAAPKAAWSERDTPRGSWFVREGPLLHGVGHLDTDSCCRTDMEIGCRGGGPPRFPYELFWEHQKAYDGGPEKRVWESFVDLRRAAAQETILGHINAETAKKMVGVVSRVALRRGLSREYGVLRLRRVCGDPIPSSLWEWAKKRFSEQLW